MTDNIKFIFKVLIKVPVMIVALYLVFNAFAFGLTYFKLLGLSYVVMQTAVENNYIPPLELETLSSYLDDIADTGVITEAAIVVEDVNDASIKPATERRQYGSPVTVGVSANYKFIMPLTPKEQLVNPGEGFEGMDKSKSFSGYADDATLESRRQAIEDRKNNINMIYTVPGLKYYPDLN